MPAIVAFNQRRAETGHGAGPGLSWLTIVRNFTIQRGVCIMPSTLFASRAPQHAAISNAPLLHLHPAALRHRGLLPRTGAGARHPAGVATDPYHLDHRQNRGNPVCRSARRRGDPLRQEQGVARLSRSLADPQGAQIRCPAPPAGSDASQHRHPRHQRQGQTRV